MLSDAAQIRGNIIYCQVTPDTIISGKLFGYWLGTWKLVLCAVKGHLQRPECVPLSSEALKGFSPDEQVSYLQSWIKT